MPRFYRTDEGDWKCVGCGAEFADFLKEENLPDVCPYCPSPEKDARHNMESRAYDYLNRTRGHGGFYDCGELGVLYIRWRNGGWSPEWIDVVPAPWLE
jgi:hypothetical protein